MNKRNQSKSDLYKDCIGQCCNPDCKGEYNLETHHVVPLMYSGSDDFINYIVLCHDCHRKTGIHKNYDLRQEELFRWKFYTEIMLIGHTSDDYDDMDYGSLLRAARKAKRRSM